MMETRANCTGISHTLLNHRHGATCTSIPIPGCMGTIICTPTTNGITASMPAPISTPGSMLTNTSGGPDSTVLSSVWEVTSFTQRGMVASTGSMPTPITPTWVQATQ